MAIENQILKDKLAGLSQSFESIIFKKSELEISLAFLSKIIQLASENDKKLWACEKKFIDMKILKEDLNYRLVKLTDAKNIIVFNQEKVLEQTKEKLAKSKEELVLALEEKERVKARLENLQSSHQSLVEVYEKMRKRALQANSRSLANSTEKMCTNCKKVYFEEENFNWSCKVHTSPFSDFWWCCGKKDKNAPGCKICKHESRDDDIAQEEVINETKSFCSTCKKKGHKCKDCPLDPNAKTKPDMIEEADRLALISKEKSLKQGQKEELNQNHSSLHNKIQELISCSESETFEEADGFFPDLMSLKRNTLFDLEKVKPIQTRHKIQTLTDESPFVLRKLKTQKKTRPQQGS